MSSEQIYYHLVGKCVISGKEKYSSENFPKVVGSTAGFPFISRKQNTKQDNYIQEFCFNVKYNDIKSEIRKYIEDYRCP